MGLKEKFFNNTSKPKGILGKLMTFRMNRGHHVDLANWGMQFLPGIEPSHVCDFGCGGGRNIQELLRRFPGAFVMGVDHSDVSVSATRGLNRKAIKKGRCEVIVGSVEDLDIPDNSFDVATAVETIYFWPDLTKCMSEVGRTIKPHGYFLIINEDDGTTGETEKWEGIIDGLKIYDREEIKAALFGAGFSEVWVYHHKEKPWIAFLAER